MNLLKETEEEFERYGITEKDIQFIGSYCGEYSCTWDELKIMANIEYNGQFCSEGVALDLVIIFTNGNWLERSKYDGKEEWEMICPLTHKKKGKNFFKLISPETCQLIKDLN